MSVDLRPSTPAERLSLKAAVRRATKLAGGGASVQHSLRVGEADLSRYGSPEQETRHCPIDVALDLDREAGAPVIVSALAAALGYRLERDETQPGTGVTPAAIASVSSEAADVVRVLLAQLDRPALSAADRAAIHKEIEEAVTALRAVQARVGA